jgi:neutral ceramidase
MTRTNNANNTKQLVRSRDECPLMGMAGGNGKRFTAGWGMLVATLALGFSLATISVAEVRGEEASHWKAGWARADITPKRFMWMAGYGGRTAPADGQLTPLWAKALALENAAGQRAVLISLDLVGIDHETTAFICGALEQECGLTRAQIAIATSHTHTGPAVGKNLGPLHYWLVDDAQRKLIDQYQVELQRDVIGAVKEALEKLVPCQLAHGSGYTTFAVNRRNNPEAQVPERRQLGQLVGPMDHDVPVLSVRDPDGNLRVVVFGYACHSTVLGLNQWSGDYPGFAQIALEETYPDCQAMFFAGCGADQNPLPRRTVDLAQTYGKRLAAAVTEVLEAPMQPVDGHLETYYEEVTLPLSRVPEKEEIVEESNSSNKFLASRARMYLDMLERGEAIPSSYEYPIGRWELGRSGVDWIFLGGEVVVDYAVRLKLERNGTRTWVAGYANDVMAYIPSRRVLNEGGYEGGGAMIYYGLPSPWTEDVEALIINAIQR